MFNFFEKLPDCFFKVAAHFVFPFAVCGGCHFSTSSPTFVIVFLVYSNCSSGCEMISLSCFVLICISLLQWYRTSFQILAISHLHIFFLKDVLIYVKGKVREKDTHSIYWLTPQMATVAWAWPGQIQGSETPSLSVTWMARPKYLDQLSLPFQVHYQETVGSTTAKIHTSASP